MINNIDITTRLEYLKINKTTKKSMHEFYCAIKGDIPDLIAGFKHHLSQFEKTKKIVDIDGDALALSQKVHWEQLFSTEYGDHYLESTDTVGKVYEAIGLTPSLYLGGYFVVLEKMIAAFLRRNGVKSSLISDQIGAMLRVVCLDIDLNIMAYMENSEIRNTRKQLLKISEDILQESEETIHSISDQTNLMQKNVTILNKAQIELGKQVDVAEESMVYTVQSIHTVASATEELDISSKSISEQVHLSQKIADEAIEQSERSRHTVTSLEATAQEISSVVGLVQQIASQTRLLALNATIEAARAGDSGKGFAVVANEVKSLASETEKAIDLVNTQTKEIQTATERAVHEIERTNMLIQNMAGNVSAIAESVEQQTAATSEISQSAASASDTTGHVNESMKDVNARNMTAQTIVEKVENISNNVVRDVNGLSESMVLLLRSSSAGNRRHSERVPLGMEVTLSQEGSKISMTTADMGLGGTSLRLHDNNLSVKIGPCHLDLLGLTVVDGNVVSVSEQVVNIAYGRHTDESRCKILDLLKKTKEYDQIYISLVQEGTKRVEAAFADALAKNKIVFDDFFDIDYQPIPNTNPRQLLTKFTAITDEYLPEIQEDLLKRMENIVAVTCVNRAAYLPTHNMVYSKEQSDDPIWNDANCRNRRIFADTPGLRAARNRAPFLVQANDRIVGDQRVLLKEVDAPIFIHGRHWGNMRMAYKP
jgi:hypothetical protein